MGGEAMPEQIPVIAPIIPNQPNLARVDTKSFDHQKTAVVDIAPVLPIGFDAQDRGIKDYFSGIHIPMANGMKPLTVRVAGGDKTILFWKQELSTGRITLPVMSINRGGCRFNPMKFSHPSMPAYRRFADRDGTRVVITPREWPCFIDYTLSIWTERKEDIEYILYQIITRFNPLAEYSIQDEFMTGLVQAKLNNVTDVSDKDQVPDMLNKVKYDISLTIEGWLWLPGRVVPTVLGNVQTLQESTGEVYGGISPNTL